MRQIEFEKLKIGDVVKLKKAKPNSGRFGRIIYKAGDYVCLIPLEGEPLYLSPHQYHNSDPMLTMIVLHKSNITLC